MPEEEVEVFVELEVELAEVLLRTVPRLDDADDIGVDLHPDDVIPALPADSFDLLTGATYAII